MTNAAPFGPEPIPVILLTGFLGTGKTTLLRGLLTDPALSGTAVLINEAGAVGLDQQMVFGAGGAPTGNAGAGLRSALLLANGCLCCTVLSDLAIALDDLLVRSRRGELPRFDRVIIETSGLADPVPIIDALAQNPLTAAAYRLTQVICVIDAALPPGRLEQRRECLAQAVCSDDLVLTHTDAAPAGAVERLLGRLNQINAQARIHRVVRGAVAARQLLAATDAGSAPPGSQRGRTGIGPIQALGPIGAFLHPQVRVRTVRFAGPTVWDRALEMIERALAEPGQVVLRIKGVLQLSGFAHPMVVQYAGGRIRPLEPLPSALPEGEAGYLVIMTARARPGVES
jgi:G3E family GTPase